MTFAERELNDGGQELPAEAQITSFERHLTVTSRANEDLVDLWFALKRNVRSAEWDVAFAALCDSPARGSYGIATIQFSPFTPARGWIVARGVDRDRTSDSDVEALIHELVARANKAVSARSFVADRVQKRRPRQSLSGRFRFLLGDLSPASRTVVPVFSSAAPLSD